MQRGNDLSTQGLPPPHDHVDGSVSIEERLDGLLLVLVDEVHIVDSQQPVVDPDEGQGQAGTRSDPKACSCPSLHAHLQAQTPVSEQVPCIHTYVGFCL